MLALKKGQSDRDAKVRKEKGNMMNAIAIPSPTVNVKQVQAVENFLIVSKNLVFLPLKILVYVTRWKKS